MKRIAWAAAGLLLALGAAGAWWLADLARPRHGEFVERRGVLVAAETAAPVHQSGDFTSQLVRLRSDSGLRVAARVLRPEGQRDRLPIIVLLAGHRTGQDAVDLIGHPGEVATVAIDYPYHGSTDVRSGASFFRSIRDIQRALLDTPPAASLVLDWLESEPWADTGRAELVGVSFGAPFVAVAGALDERFRRVWFIHGGAGNRGWIEHNLGERIPQAWLRPLVASFVHLLAYGNSFDTEAWVARIAPRPVVIIGARDDEQLPEHKVAKLYAAANEPKELLWTDGGHVDPRRADIVRALLEIVHERVDRPRSGDAVP